MHNLVLIGFGNVNRALLELLEAKRTELEALGIQFQITGVYSRRLGFIINPNGLNVAALLADQIPPNPNIQDVTAFLKATRATVLFEASSLEPFTGQPAIDHIRTALELGAHAITANKGPIVHAAAELEALARSKNIFFRYEATFMGGIPIYSLLRECLPVAKLLTFKGLPNSTSTVILEAWENGLSYEEGVRHAQDLGVAETDPSMDVDGWDSAVKIVGLANTIMNANLKLSDCSVTGIRTLTPEQVRAAKQAGQPIRLVASLRRTNSGAVARVAPEPVSGSLATVTGCDMLARFEFDVLPAIELISRDSGAKETAYDMMADFVNLAKS
jgi:homoserine dehydrogenase